MDGVLKQTEIAGLAEERSATPRACWPEFLMCLAATSITLGIIWDISWHSTIGRDTFWTMAHMAIYFGGTLGGSVAGWLAIKHTFFAGPEERAASVSILGARAPLGAWVTIWGAVAMLTSAPFDDWWHNAYGLDVKIISPPHALLGLGMFGISVGALLLAAMRQNREPNGPGAGMFIYMGGIFIVMGAVFVMEYTLPNLQHAATFYKVCSGMFAFRLVTLGRAGRVAWPATKAALVYMGIECFMIWLLPMFPGQPKLAPIFNPVTHMVPPPFPLLLVFPALGIDLVLRAVGDRPLNWWQKIALAVALGVVFLDVFLGAQWLFSKFLLSPQAENWFFVGNRFWGYGNRLGTWRYNFWHITPGDDEADLLNVISLSKALLVAAVSSWIGVLWGGWMKKVKR